MPKELTHIFIAQDVVQKVNEAGQSLLAQVINRHLGAYYLGSIIPDALYYDVPPFRLNPRKYMWVSRAFHKKEKAKNDQKAVHLFHSIAGNPRIWPLKMAFAAGVITHTVADRIFHELIEDYTSTWGEEGTVAMATHREIETLIDMILLRPLNLKPRQLQLGNLVQLDKNAKHVLFRFFLTHLLEGHEALDSSLVNALKRAYDQQRLFFRLFAARPLYHITKFSNRAVGGRLRAWQRLFYPDVVAPQRFPVLDKIRSNSPADASLFDGGFGVFREAASNEAIQHINQALKAFAVGK